MKIKKRKIVLYVLAGIFLIYIALQVVPYGKKKVDTPFKIGKGERPLVISHGGAKQLNPENTWMAFNYSSELGVDVFEMDLCLTKDDVLITHHNLTVDDYTKYTGKVADFTYEEISKMNYGYDFKDLNGNYPYRDLTDAELEAYGNELSPVNIEDMFAKWGKDMLYIIEIKDGGERGCKAADILLGLIEKYGLEKNVCFASFHQDVMKHFEKNAPSSIVTSFDEDTATDFVIANYAGYGIFKNYRPSGFQLSPEQIGIPLDTNYLIYKIHKNNMFVHYWTINDKATMKKLIKRGADGIITDRPDLLIEVLGELGYEF